MIASVNGLVEDTSVRTLLDRLCRDADLPVSASFLRNTSNARDPAVLHAHLESLLLREPGIFLERYGMNLSMQELQAFEGISDTTVQHYVRQYTEANRSPATSSVSKAVKNRRFAMMKKLVRALHQASPSLHCSLDR